MIDYTVDWTDQQPYICKATVCMHDMQGVSK
jgi:hypothetical protein